MKSRQKRRYIDINRKKWDRKRDPRTLLWTLCLRIHSFTSIAEKDIIVPDIQSNHSQESQPPAKKKYRDSDLSRLDVMKVARPVFACKEQSVLY